MERRNKRRVAHVGHTSEKNRNLVADVVTNIMKRMDSSIAESGSKEVYEILKATTEESDSRLSNVNVKPAISNHASLTPSQKKLLGSKRHPLMAKVQKNINFIKHNRNSIPKPRAHLGGLNERKMVERTLTQKSSQLRTTKSTIASCKSRPNKFRSHIDESSSGASSQVNESGSDASPKCGQMQDLSSDSEFETFISTQKQATNWKKSKRKSKDKGKIKAQKDLSKKRKANFSKKTKLSRYEKTKSLELRSSDEEVTHKKFRKQESVKISSKVTATNRLTLSYSSDSSVASSVDYKQTRSQQECSKPVEKERDVDAELFKQINANDQRCTVIIERNPTLEETVSRLKSPLHKCESNHEKENSSNVQDYINENVNGIEDEIVVDSDDECEIICEVPKTASDICVPKRNNSESDIQISNVVSLQELKDYISEYTVSHISNSCGENSGEINFEKLKEAVKTAQVQEIHTNFTKNSMPKENFIEAELVPTDLIETVNKIDFRQILSLTNNESNERNLNCTSLSGDKFSNSVPCSPLSTLPLNSNGIVAENHWQNVKNAIDKNFAPRVSHISFEMPESEANFVGTGYTTMRPAISAISSDLNSSTLKQILSNAERLSGVGENDTLQDASIKRTQLESREYNDPADEIDSVTSTKIQELLQGPGGQTLSKLFNMFSRTKQELFGVENLENAALGLKMLQEIEANKHKQSEIVVEHVMRHDPCFYSTCGRHVETINNRRGSLVNFPEYEENNSSVQTKKCANCGKNASIGCSRCMTVFFCSEECGVCYWENKHYKECSGLV